jgi:hypothetical protein
MTLVELKKKLEGAGWMVTKEEDIVPDMVSGIKHFRAIVHRVTPEGKVATRKVGYYLDADGALGAAGAAYPDADFGDLRELFDAAVAVPVDPVALAVAEVKKQAGVCGASHDATNSTPSCIVVRAVVVESGTATPKMFAVFKSGTALTVLPFVMGAQNGMARGMV